MNQLSKNMALWLIIFLMMYILYSIFNAPQLPGPPVKYSDFIAQVDRGQITGVVIENDKITATDITNQSFEVYAPEDVDLIRILREKNVSIEVKPPSEFPWFVSILLQWLPMIILIGIWIFLCDRCKEEEAKHYPLGKAAHVFFPINLKK